jgi:xanthine dehydrogenase accessory factor
VTLLERLARLGDEGGRAVLFTVVEGNGVGAKSLLVEGAETLGDGVPAWATGQFDELVRRGRNQLLEGDGAKVFVEWYGPPPRLLVYGAVDTAEALARGAKLLGWTAIVADARATFLTPERIPSADRLLAEWPDEAIAEVAPDHQTAIVVLTHDDKFDEPALLAALQTDAFYIGALGSRRNQERRRERLLEAGASEAQLGRISGPCGLDIGAESQAETALSILAEALAARAGRGGGPLRQAKQRIHAERS